MSYRTTPYRHSLIDRIGLDIRIVRLSLIGYKRDKGIGGMVDEG